MEDFEKAATANWLTNDQKLEVVHIYLTSTAYTWYQDHHAANNITYWEQVNAQPINILQTFKQPFLELQIG